MDTSKGRTQQSSSGCSAHQKTGSALTARAYYLFLLIFLSFFYFSFGTYRNWPYKIESDGKYYYQYLMSGFYDQDFDFTNNYQTPRYEWMEKKIDHYDFKYQISPITGRPANVFTSGQSILWFPFFVAAKTIVFSLNSLGFTIDTSPWGRFVQYAVMYSAVIYTVLTLYLLNLLLLPYFEEKAAFLATWLILVSTNLFYYTVFESSMSHVYDLFTFVLFLFLFVRATNENRPIVYAGLALAGALHVLVRIQNIVTILLFSVVLLLIPLITQRKRLSIKLVFIYAGTLLTGLLPIPLINMYLFGTPFTIPQGTNFLNLSHPQALEILFSARNGLFSTHPLLLIAGFGFVIFIHLYFKEGKMEKWELLFFIAMFLAFILQVYINSIAMDWWAGDSFGQRRLISSFPLFAFGFTYLLQKIQKQWPGFIATGMALFSVAGIYLTFIHVFLWSYDEPHNILAWMFYYAPQEIIKTFP